MVWKLWWPSGRCELRNASLGIDLIMKTNGLEALIRYGLQDLDLIMKSNGLEALVDCGIQASRFSKHYRYLGLGSLEAPNLCKTVEIIRFWNEFQLVPRF